MAEIYEFSLAKEINNTFLQRELENAPFDILSVTKSDNTLYLEFSTIKDSGQLVTIQGIIDAHPSSLDGGPSVFAFNDTDLSYEVAESTPLTTTSTTYILMTGMSSIPSAGRWNVSFNATLTHSSKNKSIYLEYRVNGVSVAHSERVCTPGEARSKRNISMNRLITVDGSQSVQLYWRIDPSGGGEGSVWGRSIVFERMGG